MDKQEVYLAVVIIPSPITVTGVPVWR